MPSKKGVSVLKFLQGYYPFGGTFNSWSQSRSGGENLYKLTGNEEQKEWEVFDFNARMYDANLGRFNSIDPLADFNQESWNPYHFNFNNPLKFVDPTGLMPQGGQSLDGIINDLWNSTPEGGQSVWTNTGGNNDNSSQGNCPEGNCDNGIDTSSGTTIGGNLSSALSGLRNNNGINESLNDTNNSNNQNSSISGINPAIGVGLGLAESALQRGVNISSSEIWFESKFLTSPSLFINTSARGGTRVTSFNVLRLNQVLQYGKVGTQLTGYALSGAGVIIDGVEYANGNLSGQRLSYRTAVTGIGVGVGTVASGGLGALVTALGVLSEQAYDMWINTVKPAITNAIPTGSALRFPMR